MKVLFTNEKINLEVGKISKQEDEVSLCSNPYVTREDDKLSFFNSEIEVEAEIESANENSKCLTSKYLAYYMYALILGAYVNVKRLYKMGPI